MGIIDSEENYYYDLVNRICNQENLSKDLTVELYTCEGYPLATNPSCYISKLSDWCLETYDSILLYAIPRPKIFMETEQNDFQNVNNKTNGDDVIYIKNDDVGFGPIPISVNCKNAKVDELKKYIHQMTSLPPSSINLQFNNNELKEGNSTLARYKIKNEYGLDLVTKQNFYISSWDENFISKKCISTWNESQTVYGKSLFFATLYALAEGLIKESEEKRKNILGHLRSITGCPPLIHALRLLLLKECITLPHRVAIQEVMMLVFKSIGPKPLKGSEHNILIQENKLLEESNIFWAYFVDYAKDYHGQTEEFSTLNLCCSIKSNRMKDPKKITDSQGISRIIDKQNVIGKINNEMLQPLPEYVRMIKSFSGFHARVWDVKEMLTTEIDLTRHWKEIISKLNQIEYLCIQLPLALKDNCPTPCMVHGENGMVCNYIGPSKELAGNTKAYEGFDPISGEMFNFDADDLDEKLRKKNYPQFAALLKCPNSDLNKKIDFSSITRPMNELEEIIMVVLDTSGSMDSKYFASKSKYELAMTGFEQLCNRTTAYNFKHMIGLVIFGKDSKLELPLTESFRHFSNQIQSFPNKNHTAIYDAIVFAIDELNSFKLKNNLSSHNIQTRILCLTDGGDNASKITPDVVSNRLITNKVVMDSILLCQGRVNTHAIAKISGGCSFQPTDLQQLLKICEYETMLSLACRKQKTHLQGNVGAILSLPFDQDPEFLHPQKLGISTFQSSEKCLANAVVHKIISSQVNPEVTKRILKELAYLQTDPHKHLEIFPCSNAVDLWVLMLEAPKGTLYEGGMFRLYIDFTKDYPNKAPVIRFITPIYHCNINSSGRICHKILDRFYSPVTKVREILNHVFGLLMEAAPDDPLDSYKASLLRSNKPQYEREAKEFTKLHASNKTKRDVRIEILGCDQDIHINYPRQFVCPLSLRLFNEPVVTCYGETYEKEEIEDYLDNVAKQDPFSFLVLEKHQLFPNKGIKEGVQEFISKLHDM